MIYSGPINNGQVRCVALRVVPTERGDDASVEPSTGEKLMTIRQPDAAKSRNHHQVKSSSYLCILFFFAFGRLCLQSSKKDRLNKKLCHRIIFKVLEFVVKEEMPLLWYHTWYLITKYRDWYYFRPSCTSRSLPLTALLFSVHTTSPYQLRCISIVTVGDPSSPFVVIPR